MEIPNIYFLQEILFPFEVIVKNADHNDHIFLTLSSIDVEPIRKSPPSATVFYRFLAELKEQAGQELLEQTVQSLVARTAKLAKVRKLPPVSFSYDGQPVNSRGDPADFVQFWLRKGAHVVIYGALGMALAAALGSAGPGVRRCRVLAGVILVLVAVLDEWHQTFVPGRTGRMADVLVDLAGYVFFIFLARLTTLLVRR
ncbi:MAG: VanZ family protein [Firmicutes bacterium]|nr:VanZ family protein [Bacillota bacterium]